VAEALPQTRVIPLRYVTRPNQSPSYHLNIWETKYLTIKTRVIQNPQYHKMMEKIVKPKTRLGLLNPLDKTYTRMKKLTDKPSIEKREYRFKK